MCLLLGPGVLTASLLLFDTGYHIPYFPFLLYIKARPPSVIEAAFIGDSHYTASM